MKYFIHTLREGNVNCQCSACTSDCLEKNAVKVVQVKLGYVEAVCKLKTTNDVCCILVCEPSYLVATEESGRINLWTMNSTWRLSSILTSLHVCFTFVYFRYSSKYVSFIKVHPSSLLFSFGCIINITYTLTKGR